MKLELKKLTLLALMVTTTLAFREASASGAPDHSTATAASPQMARIAVAAKTELATQQVSTAAYPFPAQKCGRICPPDPVAKN